MDTNPANKFSAAFREMADRIDRNLEVEFSGAMLIVPPTGAVIATMITDPTQDLEAFLSHCQGKLQVALAEQQLTKAGGQSWPRGR